MWYLIVLRFGIYLRKYIVVKVMQMCYTKFLMHFFQPNEKVTAIVRLDIYDYQTGAQKHFHGSYPGDCNQTVLHVQLYSNVQPKQLFNYTTKRCCQLFNWICVQQALGFFLGGGEKGHTYFIYTMVRNLSHPSCHRHYTLARWKMPGLAHTKVATIPSPLLAHNHESPISDANVWLSSEMRMFVTLHRSLDSLEHNCKCITGKQSIQKVRCWNTKYIEGPAQAPCFFYQVLWIMKYTYTSSQPRWETLVPGWFEGSRAQTLHVHSRWRTCYIVNNYVVS